MNDGNQESLIPQETVEKWAAVPGYIGIYEVSSIGRVRVLVSRKSTKAGRILNGYPTNGYYYVRLSKLGKDQAIPMHRLVLSAFAPSDNPLLNEVRHLNGDRADNRLENLQWVTHSEAMRHSVRHSNKTPRPRPAKKFVPFDIHPLTAEELSHEKWLPIPGYEAIYEASDKGRIRSVVKRMRTYPGDVIGGSQHSIGYRYIHLTDHQGITTRYLTHRLILRTFKPIEGCEALDVNHINADKADNRLENLEWATRSQNILHAIHVSKTKVVQRGTDVRASYLRDSDIREIRHLHHNGNTQVALAKKYGVSQVCIHNIVRYKTWAHIE